MAATDDAGGALLPGPDRPTLPAGGQPGDGPESLTGTVVDAQGSPLGDVAITAVLELGPGDASGASRTPPPPVIALAGADGGFTLAGLQAGRHRLRVEGADIFTAEVRFVAVPSDGLRIMVARRVEVTGQVEDGGHGVAGAIVTIDGDAIGGRLESVTDAQGGFAFGELPEGAYRVWAHQNDLAARAVRAPRLGAGPFAPVQLTLEPATIVVGKVVDRATGIGIRAAVALEPADVGAASAEAARFARAGDDGVFRLEGVPHGRWLVDVWAPGWLSGGGVEIQAGRALVELDMVAGAIVEGTVVDALGRPVAGATIRASGQGALGRGLEASAAVDADRLRRFSGFAPAGAVAASADDASASLGGAGVGRVAPPGDFTSDPRFVPRGELGVLLGPLPFPPPPGGGLTRQATIVGAPAGGATAGAPDPVTPGVVTIGAPAPLVVDAEYQPRLVTDADGRFRVTGLDAGTWTIIAAAPGMADGQSARLPLDAGKVVQGIEVVLSPGTFVIGTVTSSRGPPVVGATVVARGPGGDGRAPLIAVTDPDGRYRLGPLAGDVELEVAAYGFGDARATLALPAPQAELPGERISDFVLVPADAVLRGRVLDGDRLPVRGAQVAVAGGAARGRRAVTDDTGWFEIAAVPDADARVDVSHPDFPPQSASIGAAADAVIVLAWGGAVEGLVIDLHTGAPLAGVVVELSGPGRVELASGPTGELRTGALAAGAWTLRVRVPGYLPIEQTVDVTAGRQIGAVTARDVRVALERGALLAGVIRDRYGQRLAGAEVVIERRSAGPPIKLEVKTDSEGELRVRDVPTGTVRVRARHGGLSGEQTLTLAAGDEVLAFELNLE